MKYFINQLMKKNILAGLISLIVVTGCNQGTNKTLPESRAGIPVTVTSVRAGQMVSYLDLSATSSFLFKAAIKAPATGYIDNTLVNPGDKVNKDQTLFTIRTKEASALLGDSLKGLEFSGLFKVKTATSGQISSIEHPTGDYVSEGDLLCQVAIPESFAFILDVPFELSGFVKLNTVSEIILPDSTSVKGTIKSRFPAMAANSQTERFIVKLAEPKNLPENLTAKIRITKESVKTAFSLPKSCILTDETMQQFWVMKLINDSTAIKVQVKTGINEDEYVQITKPSFKPSDLFLSSGNFGLGDTAYVKVRKNSEHEQ